MSPKICSVILNYVRDQVTSSRIEVFSVYFLPWLSSIFLFPKVEFQVSHLKENATGLSYIFLYPSILWLFPVLSGLLVWECSQKGKLPFYRSESREWGAQGDTMLTCFRGHIYWRRCRQERDGGNLLDHFSNRTAIHGIHRLPWTAQIIE